MRLISPFRCISIANYLLRITTNAYEYLLQTYLRFFSIIDNSISINYYLVSYYKEIKNEADSYKLHNYECSNN